MNTAEEFLKDFNKEQGNIDKLYYDSYIINYAKEFAKMHVKAALKQASEQVDLRMYKKSQYSKTAKWKKVSKIEEKEGVDLFSYECLWKPSKSSILNAYPDNLIK